ncbi:indole-3-glycerol phosphate synthase TrpC [Chloroflexota bacterium]
MLDKIIIDKREEVEERQQSMPLSSLEEQIAQREAPLDLALALNGEHTRLIAEVKRASPSRGVLCPDFNPAEMAKIYVQGGAAAISVLTDAKYFQGSTEHLVAIRKEVELPLLRKDFIIHPYQVYQSRACGADALLLIAAALSQQQLNELLLLSHSLGLKCLVEVHNEAEVERALLSGAEIIGINNRDLNTFTSDIDTTLRLLPLIPAGRIVVSESGIKNRDDVAKIKGWGVNAILVGEALVTADDVDNKMRELML